MRLSLQNKEMRKEARRNYEATTKQLRSNYEARPVKESSNMLVALILMCLLKAKA